MNVLIIGGDKGIGRAMAEQLLSSTDQTIITTSRSYSKALQKSADNCWQVHLDLTDVTAIDHFANQMNTQFKQIDWLINCGGILHDENHMPEKSLKMVNSSQLMSNYQTNAMGHLLVLQAMEQLLSRAKTSVVVSISARIGSIADNHLGGWYAYRMSKAALNMGLKTLAIEWHRKHPKIKFLLIHPGTTDTGLSKPFQRNLPAGQLQSPKETATMLIQQIKTHQNHDSKFPLFIDYKGDEIAW